MFFAQLGTGIIANIMLNAGLLTQISQATGVEIGAKLFSNPLSEKHQATPDYLGMMEHNLVTLQKSLP